MRLSGAFDSREYSLDILATRGPTDSLIYRTYPKFNMSDLYRSAMHARISKLPAMPPPSDIGPDGDEEEEAADSLGSLPSSAGPLSMQV